MFRTLFILLSALLTSPAIASAAPCIDANGSCTEWVSLGGASRSLVYRTYPLDERNERITRVLIMVHGAGRDADHYFTTAPDPTLALIFPKP